MAVGGSGRLSGAGSLSTSVAGHGRRGNQDRIEGQTRGGETCAIAVHPEIGIGEFRAAWDVCDTAAVERGEPGGGGAHRVFDVIPGVAFGIGGAAVHDEEDAPVAEKIDPFVVYEGPGQDKAVDLLRLGQAFDRVADPGLVLGRGDGDGPTLGTGRLGGPGDERAKKRAAAGMGFDPKDQPHGQDAPGADRLRMSERSIAQTISGFFDALAGTFGNIVIAIQRTADRAFGDIQIAIQIADNVCNGDAHTPVCGRAMA